MELKDFLTHFDVKHRSNGQYKAICPAHRDKNASLSISEKNGRIAVYCHAGCSTESVLNATGLSMSDLFVKNNTQLQYWQRDLIDMYDYYDASGKYAYSKLRYQRPGEDKFFRFGFVENGKCDFKNITKERYLYNLKQVQEAIKRGETVFIVEGEKDVETMKKIGLTATTSGGAKTWTVEHGKEFAEFFRGAEVVILQDNDNAGKAMTENIIRDIKGICARYKVIIPSTVEHGDVTDYLNDGHSKQDLLSMIDAVAWEQKKSLLVRASDVVQTPTEWLWYPYIVSNNVNIFGGEAGTGKTWNLMLLAAAITLQTQPEGMPGILKKRGNVLYIGGEDGNSDTASRLQSVGANMKNVFLVEDRIDIMSNVFLNLIDESKPVLVIIDPLLSYVGRKYNLSNYADAREIFDYLRDVARTKNICMLLVIHPPKKDDYRLIHRFTGSGGFVDAARTVTYLGYHPEARNKRVGINVKTNLVKPAPYIINWEDDLGAMWGGEDGSITMKMIEKATRLECGPSNDSLDYYVHVIEEVLKMHPEGLHSTVAEILKEFSRISTHQIDNRSFGHALNNEVFKAMLEKKGIKLTKGSRTDNRQKYYAYPLNLLTTP